MEHMRYQPFKTLVYCYVIDLEVYKYHYATISLKVCLWCMLCSIAVTVATCMWKYMYKLPSGSLYTLKGTLANPIIEEPQVGVLEEYPSIHV